MLAKTGDTTEQATADEIQKRISPTAIKKLLKDLRSRQDDIDNISGQMGQAVAKATEKVNLNRKMFGWIRQLDRMPPEKLAVNIDDFMHMLDISGLNERAASAQRLPIESQEAEED